MQHYGSLRESKANQAIMNINHGPPGRQFMEGHWSDQLCDLYSSCTVREESMGAGDMLITVAD